MKFCAQCNAGGRAGQGKVIIFSSEETERQLEKIRTLNLMQPELDCIQWLFESGHGVIWWWCKHVM